MERVFLENRKIWRLMLLQITFRPLLHPGAAGSWGLRSQHQHQVRLQLPGLPRCIFKLNHEGERVMIPDLTPPRPVLDVTGTSSRAELGHRGTRKAHQTPDEKEAKAESVAEVCQDDGVSWDQDYCKRMNPGLLTRLLRKAVPVLEQVDWRVAEVEDQKCHSILPVSQASTNQHGTHQAALISLAADYTGGIALATLIRGVPVIGVHPCRGGSAASLWLASMKVKYLNPSTGDLHGKCAVPDDVTTKVRRRFADGKRVLLSLQVKFTDDSGKPIADAEMRYFMQARTIPGHGVPAKTLKEDVGQKLKASARLVAGLRAKMNDSYATYDSRYDELAAGPHGAVLAERLTEVLPQLQQVVAARTLHIDRFLADAEEIQQVVLLGVGLDMRPFRIAQHGRAVTTFELDLPVMLEERRIVVSNLSSGANAKRFMLGTDFRQAQISQVLNQCRAFDSKRPTLVIFEGCSMYLSKYENMQLMLSVRKSLKNPRSAVWADMVSEAVVEDANGIPEISEFLTRMEQLGESFIFGCDDPASFLQACGFGAASVLTAREYLSSTDPSLDTYQFVVSRVAA